MRKNQWFASVVLSVLISASGMAYAHDGNDWNGGPDGGPDGGKAWHHDEGCSKIHLSDAKKNLVHETMKKTFEQDKALWGKMHDLHKKLHDVVMAPNFDAKSFEAITAQIQETRDRIHKDRTHAFASIAAQFTPEEREMLIRMHKNHHDHHQWHHQGEGGPAGWHGGHDGPHGPGGPGGPDGQGWQPQHGQWQPQQPPVNNDVMTGATPQNSDYPPYKTWR